MCIAVPAKMWEALLLTTQVAIIVFNVSLIGVLIRLRRGLVTTAAWLRQEMDCDELIDQLLEDEDALHTPVQSLTGACDSRRTMSVNGDDTVRMTDSTTVQERMIAPHRERLAALVAGGQARQYLGAVGQRLTADQIDAVSDEEIGRKVMENIFPEGLLETVFGNSKKREDISFAAS